MILNIRYIYIKNDISTWPRSTAWREQANGCEEVNVKRKKNNNKDFSDYYCESQRKEVKLKH